jgi:hypothetical protein
MSTTLGGVPGPDVGTTAPCGAGQASATANDPHLMNDARPGEWVLDERDQRLYPQQRRLLLRRPGALDLLLVVHLDYGAP